MREASKSFPGPYFTAASGGEAEVRIALAGVSGDVAAGIGGVVNGGGGAGGNGDLERSGGGGEEDEKRESEGDGGRTH